MSGARLALACALACALAAPAWAKVQTGVVTAEEIMKRAELAEAERIKKKADAEKDPVRDLIQSYADKKLELKEWGKLTAIMLDAKTPEMQPYRRLATEALVRRFEAEGSTEQSVREIRREAGIALLDLMDAKNDEVGVGLVDYVYSTWWRRDYGNTGFKPNAKLDDRKSAKKRMAKFLKSKD